MGVNLLTPTKTHMFILQESCIDIFGNLVIYALVNILAMNLVMRGGNSAYVVLFPSRFAILLDRPKNRRAITIASHKSRDNGA
jgi:homeobox-leucine zipper protein